ncbi:MAG: HAD family hydrolase [Candidatus Aminicenantaceae bacterium]
MLKAILFDLDDTLLINNMASFIPAYFELLSAAFTDRVPAERLSLELIRGIEAMDANDGSGSSNEEAFEEVFYSALSLGRAELQPVFERFYAEEFPKLRSITRPMPGARRVVAQAFSGDRQVVIATNPVFPRVAVEQRLDWAGVSVLDFVFDLVTHIENMHATKARPAYYREILSVLGREPQECLMVGDDWQRDMVPAAQVGIPVFWITGPEDSDSQVAGPQDDPVPEELLTGSGSLEDVLPMLPLI